MPEIPERTCELGVPGPMRDRLVDAVLQGHKTATTSLLAEWTQVQEPLPGVGERQAVVDSDGKPVAIIELVAVAVIELGQADLQLAVNEGEGFGSVTDWRAAHERFWTQQVLPSLSAAVELDDATAIVVERFALVARLP